MYTAVLAGRISNAGALGSSESLEPSNLEKSFSTLTESMLFAGASDAAARHSLRDMAR
jgi:hypothetical protein